MKTLTTFAFLAVLTIGFSANANLMMKEGYQNFLYYFGKPCPCQMVEPCKPACPPEPCDICS